MGDYTNVHRGFIQIMLARNCVPATEALDIYKQLCINQGVVVNPQEELQACVSLINTRIKFQLLLIKKATCEVTGILHYCLVYTEMNNPTALSHEVYDTHEHNVYKKIIDMIVEAQYKNGREITAIDVMNAVSKDKDFTMTMSEVDACIKKLVEDRWLLQDKRGLHLSISTLAEMEPYLKSCYEGLLGDCCQCKNMVIRGDECHVCDTRVHYPCLEEYEKRIGRQFKCPSCGWTWQSGQPEEDEGEAEGASSSASAQ